MDKESLDMIPGVAHKIKTYEQEYRWTIFNLATILNKIKPLPRTPPISLGGHEFYLQLYMDGEEDNKDDEEDNIEYESDENEEDVNESNHELQISVEAVTEDWDKDQTVTCEVEMECLCGNIKVLEELHQKEYEFDKSEDSCVSFNIEPDKLAYEKKLSSLKKTDNEIPFNVIWKLKLYSTEIVHLKTSKRNSADEMLMKEPEGYKNIFETDLGCRLSDFKIICDDQEFAVHKIVLAAKSKYFLNMLTSDCVETKENIVRIMDMKKTILLEFLRFIYCGYFYGIKENAEELLVVADKYQIEDLKNVCEQYFSNGLKDSNLTQCIRIANLYNADKLKEKINEFVSSKLSKKLKKEAVDTLTTEQKFALSQVFFQSNE